jgi:hypothetical protein
MHWGKARRAKYFPNRTRKEKYLWKSIHENIIHAYENELAWAKKIKRELLKQDCDKSMSFITHISITF